MIINRHKTGEGIESVRENTCMYIPMYVCAHTVQCMERIFHLEAMMKKAFHDGLLKTRSFF